jgi:hypothetical protein
MIAIEFDAQKAVKAMEAFPKKTQIAAMRALNRAGDSGRSMMASSIAKDMGLKAKDAKAAVRIVPATMDRLGSTNLFNQSGLAFLRDAWIAAEFGSLRKAEELRRSERSPP